MLIRPTVTLVLLPLWSCAVAAACVEAPAAPVFEAALLADAADSGTVDARPLDVDSEPKDAASEAQTPCPIDIGGFGIAGQPEWLRFGQVAELGAAVLPAAAELSIAVEPPEFTASLTPDGVGAWSMAITDWTGRLRTTTIELTLTAATDACERTATTQVRILGDVLATETDGNLVHAFRSDGTWVGAIINPGLPQPDGLVEVAPGKLLVGNRNDGPPTVYSLEDGSELFTLAGLDPDGDSLYGPFGSRAPMAHTTHGELWVGGVDSLSGNILIYDADGNWLRTIFDNDLTSMGTKLLMLPNGKTVFIDTAGWDWQPKLLDIDGAFERLFASGEPRLIVDDGTLTPGGSVAFIGRPYQSVDGPGRIVRTTSNGLVIDSVDIDFTIDRCVTALGGALIVSDDDGLLRELDSSLSLAPAPWSETTRRWTELMVLGGF